MTYEVCEGDFDGESESERSEELDLIRREELVILIFFYFG